LVQHFDQAPHECLRWLLLGVDELLDTFTKLLSQFLLKHAQLQQLLDLRLKYLDGALINLAAVGLIARLDLIIVNISKGEIQISKRQKEKRIQHAFGRGRRERRT
jgi:hypothetical protein